MQDDTLLRVEGVSKKFCRDLKRSLWYGMSDLAQTVLGSDGSHRLHLRKGEFIAVNDVSFAVKRGECLGLIGPNGCGKSTLLKMISGLIPPDSGRIRVRGRVGALIELTAGFNPILTGRENIYINAAVLGLTKRQVDAKLDEIIDFAEMRDSINAPVQSYSSGMKARLGFAVAAHLNPDLLLVDEVLAVGDVAFRLKCFKHMLGLRDRGTSIFLVTHNMGDITRVCDRTVVLNQGRLVCQGSVPEGIAAYEAAIASRRNQGGAAPEGPERAWVESVKILDSAGRETDQFMTGDEIHLCIELGAIEMLEDARIVVHVESGKLGTLGSFSSRHSGFRFDIVPPRTTLHLALPDVPLLVGAYGFRFSLSGPGITDFCAARESADQFRVVGPPLNSFGYGLNNTFRFDHRWGLAVPAAAQIGDSAV